MPPSPSAAASQQAISDFISVIRATPEGESLTVSILRSKSSEPITVEIQPQRQLANAPKSIGVLLTPNYVRTEVIKADNPIEAITPAAKLVASITGETATGLITLF